MNFSIYKPQTEIEFLSRQTLVNVTGSRTSDGVIVSHVPLSNTTFVLIGAKLSASGVGGDFFFSGALRVNDVNQELARIGFVAAGNGLPLIYEFILKGLTVVGDGVQAIDINLAGITGTNMTVAGIIYGYTRNT